MFTRLYGRSAIQDPGSIDIICAFLSLRLKEANTKMPRTRDPADDSVRDAVDDAKRNKRLINAGAGVAVGSIFQPLQVSKVLIQLGYEPFPLQRGRAFYFFGREKRYLPNALVYAKGLYQDYGLSALYRGVTASICGNLIGAAAAVVTEEHLAKYYGMGDNDETTVRSTESQADGRKFVRRLARGSLSKVAGIVVARPFQIVMIRMIAQHVGGEEVYQGVFGSLRQIYKEDGLPGLFSGLVPQIVCELCVYWTVSSATYLIEYLWKSYVEKDRHDEDELDEDHLEGTPPKAIKNTIHFMVPFVVNSIFYPLQLVSTVMAVNGSGLVAGVPPFVPIYPTWTDCYHDLSAKDQLKRGAKMFFRFYEKPVTYRYGQTYALPNA